MTGILALDLARSMSAEARKKLDAGDAPTALRLALRAIRHAGRADVLLEAARQTNDATDVELEHLEHDLIAAFDARSLP